MKIKKNDTVLIISGKDRIKSGKVIKSFPKIDRIIVEGVNICKKHVKSRKAGSKGEKIEVPLSIHVSNVKLMCPKCGKATRVGYHLSDEVKSRFCKKCKQEI